MKILTDLFPKLNIDDKLLKKVSVAELKNAYAKKSTREIGFTLMGEFSAEEIQSIKKAIIDTYNASEVKITLEKS